MRIAAILLVLVSATLVGCIHHWNVKLEQVRLAGQAEVYNGTLAIDLLGRTGELSIPKGPKGESFKGPYRVSSQVDPGQTVEIETNNEAGIKTTIKMTTGAGVVAFWDGRGNMGSTITARLIIPDLGLFFGMSGTAKDSDGTEYNIYVGRDAQGH